MTLEYIECQLCKKTYKVHIRQRHIFVRDHVEQFHPTQNAEIEARKAEQKRLYHTLVDSQFEGQIMYAGELFKESTKDKLEGATP